MCSIICQIIAGVYFFLATEWDIHIDDSKLHLPDEAAKCRREKIAYACVFAVLVLNIMISAFDATYGSHKSMYHILSN